MTHTQESNFVRIADGLDVDPLLKLLDAKPELWKDCLLYTSDAADE